MKGIRSVLLVGPVLILSGCAGGPSSTPAQPEAASAPETMAAPVEEKGIITDRLIYNEPNMKGEVRRNKLTKEAVVETTTYINDSEEWEDDPLLGNFTMVPFLVNFVCDIYTLIYFNKTGLEGWWVGGNLTLEETEEDVFLEGYTVTEARVFFRDKETDEKIAECTATGPAWEDIEFKAYREYPKEQSLFDAVIGDRNS